MFLALYVLLTFALFLPFSILLRFILIKLGIDAVLQEIRELAEKASKISPKEKRMRMVRGRYEMLKRKLRNFSLVNLFILWIAIFTAITVSNLVLITLEANYGATIKFRSPLRIPGIVVGEEQLNILLVLLAIIMAYQPLHNKLSLMQKIYEA